MQTLKTLDDFKDAKITSQQGVYLYDLISQIPGAQKETAMGDFAQMRQALEAGVIDAYVSERPEALTAESANAKFKMIQPEPGLKLEKRIPLSLSVFVRMTNVSAKSMLALKPSLKMNKLP